MEWINLIVKSLEYGFIHRALLCGVLIGISASLMGVFLVLKRLSLLSDGLSHVSFATVAFAVLIGAAPVAVSLPMVIIASLIMNYLVGKGSIHTDSAIGLVSAFSVAVGVIIVSVSRGFNTDLFGYLFGSILAINDLDLILAVILSVVVIVLVILFRNELFLVIYDEDYSKVAGINPRRLGVLMSVLQSVVIVIGVRIVGAMLISSLILFPVISSLQIIRNFRLLMVSSVLISMVSIITGIFFAFIFNFPAGAMIVVLNGILFFSLFILNRLFRWK